MKDVFIKFTESDHFKKYLNQKWKRLNAKQTLLSNFLIQTC